jgi:hypothetical protein
LTTYLYFSQATNWTTTAYSDDGSTLYLNNVAIATMASCVDTSVSLNFRKGWNKLVWVFNENTGGDAAYFKTGSIKNVSNLVYMTAYPTYDANVVINEINNFNVTNEWKDVGITLDSNTFPDGEGSYMVQVWRDSYYFWTGVMSVNLATNVSVESTEEVLLHGGGYDMNNNHHLFLRVKGDTSTKKYKL